MNKNNPLYEYADKLNEYGVKLVKKFTQSKEYNDLCSKVNDIEKEIDQLNIEYERKFRNLINAKLNVQLNEIPKAKDEYVRQHIEGYKMHLRTKDADNSIETYIEYLNKDK